MESTADILIHKYPKVTVFLSSYNHAKYLHESIDSVLNQTFSDFKLVIVDDGSIDDSWAIINSYSDPRIQALRNVKNKHMDFSELSIKIVPGEYIAIHHSDDVWEPEKLDKQVAFLDAHPEIGAVFTNATIIGEQGKPFKDKNHFYYSIFEQPNRSRFEWLNFFFYHGNGLCHPSILIRMSCYETVGLYKPGLAQIPDFDLWVRLCLKYEIFVLPEKLIRFRVRAGELNLSGNRPEVRIRARFENLQMLKNYLVIQTYQEFVKIFPDAEKYYRQDGYDIGFMLGMLALESPGPEYRQLFGLELLFNAINDPLRAKKIHDLYGFTPKDFFTLTAKYDVFSIELKNNLAEKDRELSEITNSKTWRLALMFRRIRVWLVPPGSWRARLLRRMLSIVLFSPIFRDNRPIAWDLALNRTFDLFDKRGKITRDILSSSPRIKLPNQQHWGVMATKHTLFIAHIICDRLRAHGCQATIITSLPNDFSLDYYIVICPQMFQSLPPGAKRIIIQMEQSTSPRWFTRRYFRILKNSMAVIDYCLRNIEFLDRKGIRYPNTYYLPIGASLKYGRMASSIEKKHEVLFYGDNLSSPRRQRILNALAQQFNVKIASEVFGQEMIDIIQQAKVVINIHYYKNALLEIPRIQECLSLGVPVISEAAQDQGDYPELNGAVRFFEADSISAMIQAVKEALETPIDPNYVLASVQESARRFEFMFDRFLIGEGFLSIDNLEKTNLPTLTPWVALSLPETVARRNSFKRICPKDFVLFDGIRRKPGWVGAGLSYSTLAKNALKQKIHRLTIMEDDVILPEDFHYKMNIINEYLDINDGKWDIFAGVIASLHPETQILNVETYKGTRFVTINRMTSLVYNVYSKKALNILANWDSKNLDHVHNTIDRYLEHQIDIRVVVTLPFLVGHREKVYSTIWGFRNSQYHNMIIESQRELQQKVENI